MIESLKISGFKSLKNFEIDFNKGLNVLVGANGVGKTTICQSLEILSSCINGGLGDYISKIGGIKSTFDRFKENDKKFITINAKGTARTNDHSEENKIIDVKYDFLIKIEALDELKITSEKFSLKRKNEKTNRYKKVLTANRENEKINLNVEDWNLIDDNLFREKENTPKEITFRENDESFLNLISRFFFLAYICSYELTNIKSFNIDPYTSRLPSDISEPKQMLGNGKYLSNSIHKLKKEDSAKYEELDSFLKQVIPNYKELIPTKSDFSFKRFFKMKDRFNREYNSYSLSDGTVKIIALLTGIVTQGERTTIIEEPENYLHPFAKRLLIEYLRDSYESGLCLLTSHSETILNCIKPEELIICNLEKNYTICKRLDNMKEIKKTIKESGFGPGFHYVTGTIN